MEKARRVEKNLAETPRHAGSGRETYMGYFLPGRYLCFREKRGAKVDKTKKGKGTKIMLAVDGSGIPLNLLTEAANISEYRLALATVDGISVARRPLHPKKRPVMLVADKGYDAQWLRRALSQRHITPYIPKRRWKGEEKAPPYNKRIQQLYATRWIVERTNAWLQNYRRITVRWDRFADSYEAFIELACILICLRRL